MCGEIVVAAAAGVVATAVVLSQYHAFGHLSVHVVLEDRPDNDRQASTYDFRYFVLQRGDFYATDTELYSVRQLAKK